MLTNDKKEQALEFATTLYSFNKDLHKVVYEAAYFTGDSDDQKEEIAQYLRKFFNMESGAKDA